MTTAPTAFDPIGPLQLKVMHYMWKIGASSVHEVEQTLHLHGEGGKPLAYTTYLTVMRNLVKRGLLDQRKTSSKHHQFVVLVDELSYKSAVLRQVMNDYCDNDPAILHRYLGEPRTSTSSAAA
jgi:predicted transcriptional regulator